MINITPVRKIGSFHSGHFGIVTGSSDYTSIFAIALGDIVPQKANQGNA